MIFYQLDYVIEKTLANDLSGAQKNLRDFVGENFSRAEAELVWKRVLDHKWHVSERLKRDVGLRVAAIDYVENFYEPAIVGNRRNTKTGRRFFESNALAA